MCQLWEAHLLTSELEGQPEKWELRISSGVYLVQIKFMYILVVHKKIVPVLILKR
jgi:hypothetical protein